MRTHTRWIALLLALAAVLAAAPANAHGLRRLIEKGADLPEVRRLETLHGELHRMLARYEDLERSAGRTWFATATAVRQVRAAEDDVEAARARLERRVRAAYQFGPAGSLEALLGASTFADLSAISEFTARAISLDDAAVRE
ncbi:MAG: hypothetical protein ACRDGW_11185, partial [Actinomycetota bacterium]